MMARRRLALVALSLAAPALSGCGERADKSSHARSDAVSSTSQAMSGPSLFSHERLAPALQALRSKASGKLLRLEIRARELTMQVEDSAAPGGVLELHYRDGKVAEPEHATLRGKGQLADNLFELSEVKLDAVPELIREAVRRVDAESGSAELVLVRKNLPVSDDVRLRVYVSSPRKSGYVDADRTGQLLD
jgi:hypothetical protein